VNVQAVTPILNVSDLRATFDWFAKLGWSKGWDWCPPDADEPTFGAVTSGECEMFLCLDGQGGRGKHGAWMSLWVDDVDAIHAICVQEGFDVIAAPEDKPWGVREMHLRHPDGHVFRVGAETAHEHPHE
jgi:predicted enzyme related to lactoylglutathione lyase